MRNKKIIIVSVMLVLLVCIGIAVFFITAGNKEEKRNAQSDNSLEEYDDGSKNYLDEEIIDETGEYSKEELEVIKNEVINFADGYYGLMFNFDNNTQDYKESLIRYFGTGDLFKDNNSELTGNVFEEFQGLNMKSEYQNYHFFALIIRDDTINPEVSLMGTVQAHFSNDKVEAADYSVLSNMVLTKVDGEWKLFTDSVSNVYPSGDVTAYRMKEYAATYTLNVQGDIQMVWDFNDVEGFQSDYTYGQEWNSEEDVLETE